MTGFVGATSVGGLLALALLAVVGGLASILVHAARLSLRLLNRGSKRAVDALTGRSRFGPEGKPEDLVRSLREKHPGFAVGPHGELTFFSAGCDGRLDFIAGRTEIRFRLDDRAKESLEVSTPSFIATLAEDDPDAFRIRGSDALREAVFADPEVARMLRQWRVPFEWRFGPGESFVLLHALPQDGEELWRWLKGAHRLLLSVPGFDVAPAVEITGVPRPSLAGTVCQVCGASLGQGAVVQCRRCATPHHEDCWAYAGECSTFACRERRFVR